MWIQKSLVLAPRPRGVHLITNEVVRQIPELHALRVGLAHFFLQHTSASLALNENALAEVRADLEAHLNLLAPDDAPHYTHRYEGPDDMPAHIKNVLVGASVSVPISDGRLALGTWQGLYLLEHRDDGGARRMVVTLAGE